MDRWAPIIRGSDVSLFFNFGISDTKSNVNGGCIVKLRITTALKRFLCRKYFTSLGEYDPGLDIWGGENLEISFRCKMFPSYALPNYRV